MSRTTIQNNSLRIGLVEGIELSSLTDKPTNILVPTHYIMSVNSVESLSTNVADARAKMKKALNELDMDKVTVNILCTTEYETMAKSIISCWQKNIGVELNGTLTVVEDADFRTKVNKGDFDLAIYPLSIDLADSGDFLSMFTTNHRKNIGKYSSDEYDRLVKDYKMYPSEQKCKDCQSYLLKNAVVMPITTESTVFAFAKGVTGIYFCGDTSNVYFYKGQKK
jgi:oligopeptide transport system substrate-binding protein